MPFASEEENSTDEDPGCCPEEESSSGETDGSDLGQAKIERCRSSRVGKNDAWLTAGIIVADVVGAGILGMPRAVALFGWALGGAVMVAMLAANVHISIVMWRIRMDCEACAAAHTYLDLCAGAFARAPAWQRAAALAVTGASQYAFIFGMLGVYLLSAGKGLGMLFHGTHICLPQWAAFAGALLLPFAGTAREMGSHQSLVWINILTLCGTVLIPLGYYTIAGVEEVQAASAQWAAVAQLTPVGILSGLSTFGFGMSSQFMLTEIVAEMKDPSELPKAYVNISAPFQLAAFMVAGLGGYYFMGDKAEGMINETLPFNAAFQVAAACLITHMLISYLIKGVVFCRGALRGTCEKFDNPGDGRGKTWLAWNAVVVLTLLAVWLLANLVPFFADAVDLLGSSLTPLACWILPIVMFARYYHDAGEDSRPKVSIAEWAALFSELVMALGLMCLGTYSSVQTLREHWHTYGYPFACHCEGMWSTCSCSAAHVGMADLCPAPGGLN